MPRVTKPRPGEPIRLTRTSSGETRYQVVLITSPSGAAKRQQVRRNFRTLAEARAFVDKTRSEVREGRFTASDATTLSELADQWLSTRRDIRAVSLEGYRQVLRPVLREHGDRRVQTITRAEIERWVEAWRVSGGVRGRGISHRSIVYTLGTLRQVLALGVAQGVLPRALGNPAEGVKPPRKRAEDRSEVVVWSVAELARFLRVADTDEWAAAWRLTGCGLRRSEVLGLTWSAVDWESGSVEVRQGRVKTGRAKTTATDDPKSAASRRTVPVEAIHPGTIAALKALRSAQPSSGSPPVAAGTPGSWSWTRQGRASTRTPMASASASCAGRRECR
jgi:integrase